MNATTSAIVIRRQCDQPQASWIVVQSGMVDHPSAKRVLGWGVHSGASKLRLSRSSTATGEAMAQGPWAIPAACMTRRVSKSGPSAPL